jgi:hypothetical protein
VSGSYRSYVPSSGGDAGRNCWLVSDAAHYNVAVKNLQQQMNYCNLVVGQNPISVDGYFGDQTYYRLRTVQDIRNTEIDGKYGRLTHNAMEFYWSYTAGQWLYQKCAKDSAV